MSKAIITLEDYDGGVNIRLEFDPPASVSGRIYGSQWLAGEMLEIAASILERAEQDEEQA